MALWHIGKLHCLRCLDFLDLINQLHPLDKLIRTFQKVIVKIYPKMFISSCDSSFLNHQKFCWRGEYLTIFNICWYEYNKSRYGSPKAKGYQMIRCSIHNKVCLLTDKISHNYKLSKDKLDWINWSSLVFLPSQGWAKRWTFSI